MCAHKYTQWTDKFLSMTYHIHKSFESSVLKWLRTAISLPLSICQVQAPKSLSPQVPLKITCPLPDTSNPHVHMCVLSHFSPIALQHYGLQFSRLLCPWGFPGKNTEWVAISPPGDPPDPGIEPASPEAPVLQTDSLPLSHRGSPALCMGHMNLS